MKNLINRKILLMSMAISIVLTVLLCSTILKNIFVFWPDNTVNLSITATGEKNINSWGTDVRIETIIVNGKDFIDLNKVNFSEPWRIDSNLLACYGTTPSNPSSIYLTLNNVRNVAVKFIKQNGSGLVNIEAGDRKETIDLYTKSNNWLGKSWAYYVKPELKSLHVLLIYGIAVFTLFLIVVFFIVSLVQKVKIHNIMNFIRKIIKYLFLCTFLCLILLFLFHNNTYLNYLNSFIIIIFSILLFLLLFKTYHYLKNIDINIEHRLVQIILLILFVSQIYCTFQLRGQQTWDIQFVYKEAESLAQTGYSDVGYLSFYDNNLGTTIFLALIYSIGKFFGITNYAIVGYIANIVMIDLSAYFLYKICKKLYGSAAAIVSLILFTLMGPVYTFTTSVYSDTLSIVFPPMLFYIYLCIKDSTTTAKRIFLFIFMTILSCIGYVIKPTAVFVVIAIIIANILYLKFNRKKVLYVVTAICLAIFLNIVGINIINHSNMFAYQFPGDNRLDKLYFFNMSMNEKGGYNETDLYLVRSVPVDVQNIFVKNLIGEKIDKLGLYGLIKFFVNKANWTWGDGTYFAFCEGSYIFENQTSFPRQFFAPGGKYFDIYAVYAQSIHLLILFCFIVPLFVANKEEKENIDIVRYTIMGLLLFLLMWETRSRYILNNMPLFLILVVETFNEIPKLKNIYNKLKLKKNQIK